MNGPVNGTGFNLTKSGTGQIRLNGANGYTGSTTINGGTLSIVNYAGLNNTSGITICGGANLSLVQVGTGTTTNTINKTVSLDGTMAIIGGSSSKRLNLTWDGNITLVGNITITSNGNSLWDINGQINLGASTLIFQADGASNRIDGNIIGATGGSLNKTSAQDLTLTGTNTYTGTTMITLGTLVTALPALTTSGGNMNFTFKRAQSSLNANTSLAIQVGLNLTAWPSSYTVGINTAASAAGVTVQQGVPTGFDTITLSIPQTPDLQKFVRLHVTITP